MLINQVNTESEIDPKMPVSITTSIYIRNFFFLLALIAVTIAVTYFFPGPIANIWYIGTLVMYSLSRNEALWLAFYLTTVDGFMGLMGLYSLTLSAIPGLPGIELAQFYVLVAFIKALRNKSGSYVFYTRYLQILGLYVVFLIIWGQASGFSGGLNAYFRVLKMVFPLTLFYSIPRLFTGIREFEKFFAMVFLIFLTGFVTQLFSLLTGIVPFSSLITTDEDLFSEPGSFRGFYNAAATLISLFAALAYVSLPGRKAFNRVILYTVISAALGMAVISATRGWMIGLGFVIIIQFIFLFNIERRNVLWLGVFLIIIFIAGVSNQKIKEQVSFSKDRLMTLETLAEGDKTADKTLQRLDVRSPVVLRAWRESPLFGWGFSDVFWQYGDGHVGNQNILLLSGITGLLLLAGFLLYFIFKMTDLYLRNRQRARSNPALILFPVFLMGWFIIHSTSGQQFGFSGLPLHIIPQAVFFSFGTMIYAYSKTGRNGKKIP